MLYMYTHVLIPIGVYTPTKEKMACITCQTKIKSETKNSNNTSQHYYNTRAKNSNNTSQHYYATRVPHQYIACLHVDLCSSIGRCMPSYPSGKYMYYVETGAYNNYTI